MAEWLPSLINGPEPIYRRLIDQLRRDIAAGRLQAGMRLPPQRMLADHLGIALSTVTKVYSEAIQQGLLDARVGSGTFVAMPRGRSVAMDQRIDLSHNVLPAAIAGEELMMAMAQFSARSDLADHLAYSPGEGTEVQRRAAAAWLQRTTLFDSVPWERIFICAGAQHALFVSFAAMARQGQAVFCDAATFNGMKMLADHLKLRLIGIDMDEQGMRPDLLEEHAARGEGHLLFLMPTLQNPTTRIMGNARREEIVAVARRHQLWIVEDDPYAGYVHGDGDYVPVAAIAPERTFYVSTLSKIVAPGLRLGILLPPTDESCVERLHRAVYATLYGPPALGALLATQWILGGAADRAMAKMRAEFEHRLQLAYDILGDAVDRIAVPRSMFIWLPMSDLDAERVARRALREGVEITPPGAPIVKEGAISGLRICLGAVADRATLTHGLGVVRTALSSAPEMHLRSLI